MTSTGSFASHLARLDDATLTDLLRSRVDVRASRSDAGGEGQDPADSQVAGMLAELNPRLSVGERALLADAIDNGVERASSSSPIDAVAPVG